MSIQQPFIKIKHETDNMTARPKWAPVIGPQYHQGHPVIAAIALPFNGPVNRLIFLCPACGQIHTGSLPTSASYRAGDYVPVTLPCRLCGAPHYFLRRGVQFDAEP